MDIQKIGPKNQVVFLRTFVFDLWTNKIGANKTQMVVKNIIEELQINNKENLNFEKLVLRVKYICKKISAYWSKHHSIKSKVLENHSDWLNIQERVIIEEYVKIYTKETKSNTQESKKRGRPKKKFLESSKRTQKRRIAELEEIDNTLGQTLKNSFHEDNHISFNAEEVLSLIVEAKLSKHQYLFIKDFVNDKFSSIVFPSYKNILKEKKRCYPDPECIKVTESSAEIELQGLLNHTALRITELQYDVLKTQTDDVLNNLTLIGKWGFDGSTGHSEYKQKFSSSTVEDGSLFVSSYVPLQLISSSNTVLWKNPRPCSTRYCRPLRFQYKKESTEISLNEEKYFKEKISKLDSTSTQIKNKTINIKHELQLTMVDGKVCSALSETSSAKCYICKATPKEMNDINKCIRKEVTKKTYELSPLHAYIRFFEYFIHLSYRLDIKKWQIRNINEKEQLLKKKRQIQSEFRKRMGLIVDKPKSGGSGTSNDGNTARRFFKNTDLSAQITGIDKECLERCAAILQALASGYQIDESRFKTFCLETATRLVELYDWYYLPASIHKVLIHGSEIIKHSLLSIGELSEETAEAKNKDIKTFRLRHTRKISRTMTNIDLLNRLLLTSDPLISGVRKLPTSNKSTLLKATLNLLAY